MRIAAACVIAATGIAAADIEPPPQLTVEVGATVTRDVGIALGYQCDKPELVAVQLKTVVRADGTESNVFAVTGVREGTTMCRAGLDHTRPSYVFDVRVTPRAPRTTR